MNKLTLLLLCIFAMYINIIAQTPDSVKNTNLMGELLMTKYDKDTSAEAVALADLGRIFVLSDQDQFHFSKFYARTVKVKILSEAGISQGTFSISLYLNGHEDESLTYLEGTTYNLENGKVVGTPLNKNTVYEEKKSTNLILKKIAMPNVKVGSVIVLAYTIKSPNVSNFTWSFQHSIPVTYSQLNLYIPPFCHYMSLTQNVANDEWICTKDIDNVERHVMNYSYHDNLITYIYKDVPAFRDESYITCREDYLIQVEFQLSTWDATIYGTRARTFLSTWKQFTETLLNQDYFGGFFYSKGNYLERIVDQLNIKGKPQLEKIKAILNYVKTNYKWNNAYSNIASKTMKDFITQKFGNSADINLFLKAMLTAAEIPAYPVLLSTRSHGKIKSNYPFFSSFNDVVCYVKTDSLSLLLDGTESMLPYYALPPQCTNGMGYIVKKNDSAWVDLKPQMAAKIMENIVVKISPDYDSLNCTFNIKASGYSGYHLRNDWNEGYDKFSTLMTKDKGMNLTDSIKIFFLNDPEAAFSMVYPASLPLIKQKIDSSGGYRLVFSPFLNEPMADNSLKMRDRKYPVDMNYPYEFMYAAIVVIPDGYKLYEKPADVTSSVSDGKATYTYTVKQLSGSIFQFTSDLSYTVPVFQPSEYKDLKNLNDLAIKKCKEPIILEKK